MRRSTGRRAAIWAAFGFLLMQLGWLLVMPPFTGIDEVDHTYRASSVAGGHVLAKPNPVPDILGYGDLIPVRQDFVHAANPACARLPYTGTYNCLPVRHLSDTEVMVASSAARYNPAYYAFIGLVTKPLKGDAALYGMRIAGALVCAGIFAVSVCLVASRSRGRWPLAALILTALPTTLYSSTLAAPNGIEMMAGLAVWISLMGREQAPESTPVYAFLGLSAALLVNMHTLGLLWLGLIVCTVAILLGTRSLISALRPRTLTESLVLFATSVAIMFEIVWVVLARTNDPRGPKVLSTNVWTLLPREMMLWPLQAIGAFPFRDEPAPTLTYAIGVLMLSGFLVLGVVAARRTRRIALAIGFVALTSYVVPVAFTVATFSRLGLNWQGRYGMPFTVGLILLLGLALDRWNLQLPTAAFAAFAVVWCVAQAVSLVDVLRRQRSDHHLVATTDWWVPPVYVIVTATVLASFVWIRSAVATPDPETR